MNTEKIEITTDSVINALLILKTSAKTIQELHSGDTIVRPESYGVSIHKIKRIKPDLSLPAKSNWWIIETDQETFSAHANHKFYQSEVAK